MQNIKKLALFSLSCLVLLSACPPPVREVTPQPPIVTDMDKCADACLNLAKLGCEEGKPIKMSRPCQTDVDCKTGEFCFEKKTCMTPCTEFCIATETAGVWLAPECVSHITSCGQLEQCPANKKLRS